MERHLKYCFFAIYLGVNVKSDQIYDSVKRILMRFLKKQEEFSWRCARFINSVLPLGWICNYCIRTSLFWPMFCGRRLSYKIGLIHFLSRNNLLGFEIGYKSMSQLKENYKPAVSFSAVIGKLDIFFRIMFVEHSLK